MKIVFSEAGKKLEKEILKSIVNFQTDGQYINDGRRNSIKIFRLKEGMMNIKSFKVPNLINKIAYRFIRESKAKRSFKYANILISREIGTPFPLAYAEESSAIGFGRSFYVSEHIHSDLTFRELVTEPDYPGHEKILRAFTKFTFHLHQNNIEFLDHSPGNTLIQIKEGKYHFYLVDLNRMNFRTLNLDERLKNFSRLTPKKEMVEVMASEYAGLMELPYQQVFEKMWYFTEQFQKKFHRKQAIKRKIKFWKRK